MERSEIIEHLRISLSVVLNRELPELSAETQILEDLEIDSIRFIELIMSLEDTLQLDVDPESLEPEVFQSVGSFADYIQTRLQQVDVAR
ncbi:acyl carrier protein [Micromonospora sp. DT46]|uniref:acyl carrier protein n=1 Tax=unclassified Micromonospora TaxID=2617518 RepID=UPI00104A13E2|nr:MULTISPECIES: phosphopantetheine-binding protein [unclassified Micromonospora]KAB1162366.1 acyl carrier protein [Micromonospora sp. AMSO12t]WSG01432.1 phosphopantetheine-binding protein [Micromonospora sp. NBC_01740]